MYMIFWRAEGSPPARFSIQLDITWNGPDILPMFQAGYPTLFYVFFKPKKTRKNEKKNRMKGIIFLSQITFQNARISGRIQHLIPDRMLDIFGQKPNILN